MKVADMHCDTITELYGKKIKGEAASILHNDLHLDLERMVAGDYAVQNFALFTQIERERQPFEYCMKTLDLFYTEMEQHRDKIGIVTCFSDIKKNMEAGRMSALLTIEEGAVCMGELSYLRDFYRLGVRMMTLTWNFPNELAYPNKIWMGDGRPRYEADLEHGLTEKGRQFVKEMEKLGMIIDVSHLSDAGFYDVLHATECPFVASHSNARALSPWPRNLTDGMIKALAERGGVAGINYCADFLHQWEEGEEPVSRVEDMAAHIKHMKQVGGIGCIGLGSDFDGIGGRLEIASPADLPKLERTLRREGFTESEIEAVFYKNVLRVYEKVLR